jgi:hypothetical protein
VFFLVNAAPARWPLEEYNMTIMPKRLLLIAMSLVMLFSAPNANASGDFDKANELYKSRQYDEAIALYSKLINSSNYQGKDLAVIRLNRGMARARTIPLKIYAIGDSMSKDELDVLYSAKEDLVKARNMTQGKYNDVYEFTLKQIIDTSSRIWDGENNIAGRDPAYKKALEQKRADKLKEFQR